MSGPLVETILCLVIGIVAWIAHAPPPPKETDHV